MFAGIGGFRAGLERAGGFECIGHSEIDKHADAAYRRLHKVKESEVFYEDATKIKPREMPEFDLLCAGFPCQAFSIAGRRQGFADPRGTLFFDIARVVRARKPAYLLLENVPGLLSHDKGRTFATILITLSRLGYCCSWQIINSKDHGVAQSRRRVYIIGCLDSRCVGEILPIRCTNTKALIQILGGSQGERVYDTSGLAVTQISRSGGLGGKTGLYTVGFNRGEGITREIKTAYALPASYYKGINRNQTQNAVFVEKSPLANAHAVMAPERETVRQNGRRIKNVGEPMFTLTSQDRHGVLLIKEATKRGYKEAQPGDSVDLAFASMNTRRGRVGHSVAQTLDTGSNQGVVTLHGRIRRLVPRECFRLQGFTDPQIDKLLEGSSNSQAYKQAGNAVTVNVIHAIGLKIKNAHRRITMQGDAVP